MQSTSINAHSIEDLKNQISGFNSFSPTLGVCFSSNKFDSKEIQAVFKDNHIQLLAASSAGEIYDDEVSSHSISIMLFDIPRENFAIVSEDFNENEIYPTAFSLGQTAAARFEEPAVILVCSKYGMDGQTAINGLNDGLGKDMPVFGGLAANDEGGQEVWVCGNEHSSKAGMALLVLDHSKIEVTGLALSGWEPIGISHTITESSGNEVSKINGQPALDVFIDYFGFFEDASKSNTQDSTMISGQFPFQIEKGGGEHILRSPIIANKKNRSLILGGSVETGQQFKFSASPGFEVIEKTISEFADFASQEAPEADALLLFSCIGRHAALGPLIEDELEGIRKNWNAPMVGAFTLGEIGKIRNGACEFHNITSSLVVLKER